MPIRPWTLPGPHSWANGPRAALVEAPERRGVRLEVRAVPLADRLNYLGLLAAQADDEGGYDWRKVWPTLLIPAVHAPHFEGGVWRPGKGKRVFRAGEEDKLLMLPASLIERLAAVAGRLSGMSSVEEKQAAWSLITHPELRLAMELCWQLGCTLTELCRRMPSWELTLWRAYFGLRNEEIERSTSKGRSDGPGESFT